MSSLEWQKWKSCESAMVGTQLVNLVYVQDYERQYPD
jgi:hypothetical protein